MSATISELSKISVCHFTSAHQALDDRIFIKEARSLAAAGYTVYLVAPDAADTTLDKVHIIGVPKSSDNRLYRMLILTRKIYKTVKHLDADIYHFHDPELLPIGLRLKRKGKIVIFDSHEDVPNQILSKVWIFAPLRRIIAKLYNCLERYITRRLDALIGVNPIIVNRLQKVNPRSVQITNYPVLEEFHDDILQESSQNICFAGNIKKEYMHHLILKALKKCQGVHYLLGGAGDESYLKLLMEMPEWEQVEYLGYLKREALYQLYRRSQAGIAIHDYTPNVGGKEGSLGFIKNFEFMMAGLPIICTDFTVWKKLIAEEKCGICVNPHDSDAIAEAINYLMSHPDEARQMGENGRNAVINKYNWHTQELVLRQLYQELISQEK